MSLDTRCRRLSPQSDSQEKIRHENDDEGPRQHRPKPVRGFRTGSSVRILMHVAVATAGHRVITTRGSVFVRRRTGPHVSIASPERSSERVRRCIVNTRPPEVYRVDDRRKKRPRCGIRPDPEPGESAVPLMRIRRGQGAHARPRRRGISPANQKSRCGGPRTRSCPLTSNVKFSRF